MFSAVAQHWLTPDRNMGNLNGRVACGIGVFVEEERHD